jgi:hypothetical protein
MYPNPFASGIPRRRGRPPFMPPSLGLLLYEPFMMDSDSEDEMDIYAGGMPPRRGRRPIRSLSPGMLPYEMESDDEMEGYGMPPYGGMADMMGGHGGMMPARRGGPRGMMGGFDRMGGPDAMMPGPMGSPGGMRPGHMGRPCPMMHGGPGRMPMGGPDPRDALSMALARMHGMGRVAVGLVV